MGRGCREEWGCGVFVDTEGEKGGCRCIAHGGGMQVRVVLWGGGQGAARVCGVLGRYREDAGGWARCWGAGLGTGTGTG